jgi:hypothetical protein
VPLSAITHAVVPCVDRSQVFNPITQTWIKRNTGTGQFMDQKKGGELFKGIRKEHKK